MELQAITAELPEISAGVLYVWLLVKGIRAWTAAIPRAQELLDGTRVWALVFGAAITVTMLTAEAAAINRDLVVQALALTVLAIGGDNMAKKLDDERVSRLRPPGGRAA